MYVCTYINTYIYMYTCMCMYQEHARDINILHTLFTYVYYIYDIYTQYICNRHKSRT